MSEQLYPLSEFTPEQAAKVAEFEAAPTPPEVLREQVARVLWEAQHPGSTDWPLLNEWVRDMFLGMADAALAVFRGQQDPAVQRVLALASELDGLVDDETVDGVARVAHGWTLNRIRAAIGGDGR